MRHVLKQLNDCNPSDLQALDEPALRRFESLCEGWAKIAEAERARWRALGDLKPTASGPRSH